MDPISPVDDDPVLPIARPTSIGISREIREILVETPEVRTLRLDNSDRLVPIHRAGQHVKLGVETASGVSWKSFSLSSPPTRSDFLDVTVRRNPDGVVSRALHAMNPGDRVLVQAPSGRFFFDPEAHREPLFFLAAGIGVTPVMSMLRSIRDRPIDRPVTVFYGCKTGESVIFAREWDDLRTRIDAFRLVITLTRADPAWDGPKGRIGPEFLEEQGVRPMEGRFFLSGPGDFNATIADWLIQGGASPDQVLAEVFGKVRVTKQNAK